MTGLGGELEGIFSGDRRCAVVGIGNRERSDDGFGPRLAGLLIADGWRDVIDAGTTPEKETYRLESGEWSDILLLDAVEVAGAEPGTAVLMDAGAIVSGFPQVSTHKMSLGLLGRYLAERFQCRVWLLGVRPLKTDPGSALSPGVEKTLGLLADLFRGLRRPVEGHTETTERKCF